MDLDSDARAMKLKRYPNIECRYFKSSTSRLVVNTVNPYNTVGSYRNRIAKDYPRENNTIEISEILDNSIQTPYTGTSNGLIREIMQDYEFNTDVYIHEQNSDGETVFSTNQPSFKSMSQRSCDLSTRPFDTPEFTASCSRSVPKSCFKTRNKSRKYHYNNRRRHVSTNETFTTPAPNDIQQAEKTTYCRPLNNMYNEDFAFKSMQQNARLKNIVRQLVIERQKEKQKENWNNYINELKNKHGYYNNGPTRISPYVPDFIGDYYNKPGWLHAENQILANDMYGTCSNAQPNDGFRYSRGFDNAPHQSRNQFYESNRYCYPTASQGSVMMLNNGVVPEHLKKYFSRTPIMLGRYGGYPRNRGTGSNFRYSDNSYDFFKRRKEGLRMHSTSQSMQTDINLRNLKNLGVVSEECQESTSTKEIAMKSRSLTRKPSVKGVRKSFTKQTSYNYIRDVSGHGKRPRGKYCICKFLKNIDFNEARLNATECECDSFQNIEGDTARITEERTIKSSNIQQDHMVKEKILSSEYYSNIDDKSAAKKAIDSKRYFTNGDLNEVIPQNVNSSRWQDIDSNIEKSQNSILADFDAVECSCRRSQKVDSNIAKLFKLNCSTERLQNMFTNITKLKNEDCASKHLRSIDEYQLASPCKCKVVECACKRQINIGDNVECACKRLKRVDDDDKVECACKRPQKVDDDDKVECACKRQQKEDNYDKVECACKRPQNADNVDIVKCACQRPQKVDGDDKVECACKYPEKVDDNDKVECACKRQQKIDDGDKVECACKHPQKVDDDDKVECACKRLQKVDDDIVECACKHPQKVDNVDIVECACQRPQKVDGYDKVECACKYPQKVDDNDKVECACKRLQKLDEVDKIECACKRLQKVDDDDTVECACKLPQKVGNEDKVECVCNRPHKVDDDDIVECACKHSQKVDDEDKVECACKRPHKADDNEVVCACTDSQRDDEDGKVECACKDPQAVHVGDEVDCACKHQLKVNDIKVECACKRTHKVGDDREVECNCSQSVNGDEVECDCKTPEEIDENKVECACKLPQNIGKEEVECICKRLENTDKTEVECACKSLEVLDNDPVECACERLQSEDGNIVKCACKVLLTKDKDTVECACEREGNIGDIKVECSCKRLHNKANTDDIQVECACERQYKIDEVDCACKFQNIENIEVECACKPKHLKYLETGDVKCACESSLHNLVRPTSVECACKRHLNADNTKVECSCKDLKTVESAEVESCKSLRKIFKSFSRTKELECSCTRYHKLDSNNECGCKRLPEVGGSVPVDCVCEYLENINSNIMKLKKVICTCDQLQKSEDNEVRVKEEPVSEPSQNMETDDKGTKIVICATKQQLENINNKTFPKVKEGDCTCKHVKKEESKALKSIPPLKSIARKPLQNEMSYIQRPSQSKNDAQKSLRVEICKEQSPPKVIKKEVLESKAKDCLCEPLQDIERKVVSAVEHTTVKPLQSIENKLDNLITSFNSFVREMRESEYYKSKERSPSIATVSEVISLPRHINSKTRSETSRSQKTDQVLYTTVLRNTEADDSRIRLRRHYSNTKIENILREEMEKSNKIKKDIKELLHTGCDRQCSVEVSFDIPTKEVSTAVTSSSSKTHSGSDNVPNIEEINTPIRTEGSRMTIAVNTDPLGLLGLLRISAEALKQLMSYMPQLNYYLPVPSLQLPHRPGVAHYVCNICGASFYRPSQLSDHIQQNHDLGRTRDCCVCRHVLDMEHDKIGLFNCKYCGKMFARAYCCELHQQNCAKLLGKQHDVAPNLMLLK